MILYPTPVWDDLCDLTNVSNSMEIYLSMYIYTVIFFFNHHTQKGTTDLWTDTTLQYPTSSWQGSGVKIMLSLIKIILALPVPKACYWTPTSFSL